MRHLFDRKSNDRPSGAHKSFIVPFSLLKDQLSTNLSWTNKQVLQNGSSFDEWEVWRFRFSMDDLTLGWVMSWNRAITWSVLYHWFSLSLFLTLFLFLSHTNTTTHTHSLSHWNAMSNKCPAKHWSFSIFCHERKITGRKKVREKKFFNVGWNMVKTPEGRFGIWLTIGSNPGPYLDLVWSLTIQPA